MASLHDFTIHLLPERRELNDEFQENENRASRSNISLRFIRRGLFLLCIGLLLGCLVLWGRRNHGSVPSTVDHGPRLRKHLHNFNTLNFLVVGDWGRQGLYNQSAVAVQMGRVSRQLGMKFVISTGDNFYETGLKGPHDSLFTESFTNVYTDPSLQTVWYSVLGNHDYMGNAMAQLSDEIVKRDSRWFCEREFHLHQPLCDENANINKAACNVGVDFFFIDTTPFIDEYWSPHEKKHFYNWTGLAPRDEQLHMQLKILTQKVSESRAVWKIVVGHHTMRSIGDHGDSKELLTHVLPILEQNGVHLYINGHDHNLQHIKRSDSPVHFVTSGGGSKAWKGLRDATKEEGVRFAYDGQGFMSVSVDPTSLTFSFYDIFGRVLYSTTLTHEDKN